MFLLAAGAPPRHQTRRHKECVKFFSTPIDANPFDAYTIYVSPKWAEEDALNKSNGTAGGFQQILWVYKSAKTMGSDPESGLGFDS